MWCHVSFRKYPKKKSILPWPNQSCCFQQMPPPSPHAHMCLGVWSVLDRPIWRISRAGGNYSVCARQLPCCYGQLLRLKTTKPLRMLFCNNALVFSFFCFCFSASVTQPHARCLPRSLRARGTSLPDVLARLLKVRVRFHAIRVAGIWALQLRRALLLENLA